MNIATDNYSESELLNALESSNRNVYYEYIVADTSGTLKGTLSIEDGQISYDSKNEVMRTFSGTARASSVMNLGCTDFYIMPWMCLVYKNDVIKWPLGRFLVNPSEDYQGHAKYVNIVGYDLGKIALDDKSDNRTFAAAGSIYTSIAGQILGSMYTNVNIVTSEKTSQAPLEWEIGTEKLTIVNDLMKSISYNPLYFDEYGVGQLTPYVVPEDREIERIYQDGQMSIIVDGLNVESSKFEVPNKFIRYVENPDAPYLISTYVNDDEDSPYSTVNRGRTIVDADSVDDIASQSDLDAYVRKVAIEKTQAVETIEFSTLNMPGHGFQNCLLLKVDYYDINSKYIEVGWEMDLSRGGLMTHRCEKAVVL